MCFDYFIGIFFFITGFRINEWLDDGSKVNINALTSVFFVLNFLAATQDIVVDGWALTMLKRFVFTLLKNIKFVKTLINKIKYVYL